MEILIGESSSHLANGKIKIVEFYENVLGGVQEIVKAEYKIFDGLAYQKVANTLNVTLEEFLSMGPTASEKNISYYTENVDGDGYIYVDQAFDSEFAIYIETKINNESVTCVALAEAKQYNGDLWNAEGISIRKRQKIARCGTIAERNINGLRNKNDAFLSAFASKMHGFDVKNWDLLKRSVVE